MLLLVLFIISVAATLSFLAWLYILLHPARAWDFQPVGEDSQLLATGYQLLAETVALTADSQEPIANSSRPRTGRESARSSPRATKPALCRARFPRC